MTASLNRAILLILITILLIPVASSETIPLLTDFMISSSTISWHPHTDHPAILTVSGPEGVTRHELAAGEALQFGLFNADGDLLPDGSYTWELRLAPLPSPDKALHQRRAQSGYFRIVDGSFVLPEEEAGASLGDVEAPPAGQGEKGQVLLDDLIVDGSACIGLDCVNAEAFGFDTVRLKENNLRLKLEDTSEPPGFPATDWQIAVNDTTAGGADRFSIEDVDAGTVPLTIEGGAPDNSLYVDDAGRVGLGTATPSEQLELQGSSDGSAQIHFDDGDAWNVGGGVGNTFTISDAGDAPELTLNANGDLLIMGKMGIGTGGPPSSLLQLSGEGSSTRIQIEETGTGGNLPLLLLRKVNAGAPFVRYESFFRTWDFTGGNFFSINDPSDAPVEFLIDSAGNLTLTGTLTTGSSTVYPDYVFDSDYPLLPLDELAAYVAEHRHLPKVPSAAEAAAGGVNVSDLQLRLLEKVEELTLYTLAQAAEIRELRARLDALTSAASP